MSLMSQISLETFDANGYARPTHLMLGEELAYLE